MAGKIQMSPEELREAHRGWLRTIVTSAIGIISLVTSTYLVISRVTEIRLQVENNTTMATKIDGRLKVLEDLRIPNATIQSRTETVLGSIDKTLATIERRLYRIETKGDTGFLGAPTKGSD